MRRRDEKLYFAIAGGALITASVVPMVAYLSRKKEEQHTGVGMLLGAVAGLTAGILLAYEPDRRARRRVAVDQMFDDDAAEAASRRIDGVLNRPEERAAKPESLRRKVDVDEDDSVDNFIW